MEQIGLQALIVDFYMPHLREAIIKLKEDNIINIKYWLINGEKYAGEPEMHQDSLDQMEKEYFSSPQLHIPDTFYDLAHQYLYPFINIDNRWNPSTETCTYVHRFNILLKIWYHIIKNNNIELMIMGNAPHAPVQFMAYVVAKSLNIKIIITEQEWFTKDRFMCFRSLNLIGDDYLDRNFIFHDSPPVMIGGFQRRPFYMENLPDEILDSGRVRILPLFISIFRQLRSPYMFLKKLYRQKVMLLYKFFEMVGYRLIELYLDKWFRKNRNTQCVSLDKKKKNVYFPLHLQPEMTTDTLGGIYEDQLLAVERLDQLLPNDWVIYIKENPAQTYYKRNMEFFRRLKGIKKAILVQPTTDTYQLIENAEFVATITGTAGWEAITAGKKCLCFGYAWYRSLAGVIRYRSDLTFEDIDQYCFTKEEFDQSYKRFYHSLFPGIVAGSFFSNLKDDFSIDQNNIEVYQSLKVAIQYYDR